MPNKNYYLYPYLVIFILNLLLWALIKHGDVVLLINANRSGFFDFFFTYWTILGEGIFVGLLFLILIIWKWRLSLVFLGLGVAQFISSQGLKRFVFGNVPRPTKYFEGIVELQMIEGVNHYSSFSFPSGHTITAFATATFFAILFRSNRLVSSLILIAAILVAVSRIYLLQHFLRDVLAGSMIGVIIAILVFQLFEKYVFKNDLLKQ